MLNKKNADSVNNPLSAYNISNYIFVNSSLSEEFCCNFPELFRRQFELFAVEIHVVFALYGNQMDVSPKATTATLLQAISCLILAATFLAKSIMPASVLSSRSKM